MDNKEWLEKMGKSFSSMTEFDFENLSNINKLKSDFPSSTYDKSSLLYSSELTDSINEFHEEKAKKEHEAIERDVAKTRYLQNISQNTDYIAKQFKVTATNLETLNKLLEKSNMTLEDIKEDVEENKQVNFEIFELLAKERFSNEKERLKTTEKLLTKLKDPLNSIDVSANITSILNIVISSMN